MGTRSIQIFTAESQTFYEQQCAIFRGRIRTEFEFEF